MNRRSGKGSALTNLVALTRARGGGGAILLDLRGTPEAVQRPHDGEVAGGALYPFAGGSQHDGEGSFCNKQTGG